MLSGAWCVGCSAGYKGAKHCGNSLVLATVLSDLCEVLRLIAPRCLLFCLVIYVRDTAFRDSRCVSYYA